MSDRDKFLKKVLKSDGDIQDLIEKAGEYQSDKEIVIAACKKDGSSLKFAHQSLQDDEEVVRAAAESDGWAAVKFCSDRLKKDRNLVLEIVKNYGDALVEAHESFRSDKEIVLAAVLQYGDAFDHADESLKTDKDILKAYEEFEEEEY
ncbi:DUF4116 domain-containing protein [Gammaproteobacteria bacterium]|nr:DUF4116 domain-containing protein [Gammaproteobacteria bacterium]